MKANVVFKHCHDPRAVLQVDNDNYFVVMSDDYVDMAHSDDISADLTLVDVKWLLNLTRGALVNIKVLGQYGTMNSAVQAVTVKGSPGY